MKASYLHFKLSFETTEIKFWPQDIVEMPSLDKENPEMDMWQEKK